MKRFSRGLVLACLLTAEGGRVSYVTAQTNVSWHTIDGGGVMRSDGGEFELSGTIGQPDAASMSGGEFELTGGFWFELRPGDCNEDGSVSLADHGRFADCLAGPGGKLPGAECLCFDLHRDYAVDLLDFAVFQTTADAN